MNKKAQIYLCFAIKDNMTLLTFQQEVHQDFNKKSKIS